MLNTSQCYPFVYISHLILTIALGYRVREFLQTSWEKKEPNLNSTVKMYALYYLAILSIGVLEFLLL